MAIEKPLKEIAAADLLALTTSQVREGKTIEFKEALNLASDDAKRKFIASVASFANASGGDIVFGIKAKDGVAEEVVPLAGFNPDRDTLMMRDLIRAHIAPKVYGFEFHPVEVEGGHAFVLRIPKTWAGAHIVTFNTDNRFYVRDANGRRLMDVDEVRAAFVGSEAISDRIRHYRQERVGNILADETPVKLCATRRFVLHVIPLKAFEPSYQIDIDAARQLNELKPIGSPSWSTGRDVDGIFNYSSGQNAVWSYVHLSRNACLEAAESFLLRPREPDKKFIPSVAFERGLLDAFSDYQKVLRKLNVDPPIVVMLSLLNVRGFEMYPNPYYSDNGSPIQRDILLLPEAVLNSLDSNPDFALRPLLDSVWHACGIWGSRNFTQEGIWQRRD
jgi:Putative DNA-binding domain